MKHSLTEYFLYINLRLLALLFQTLPLRIALFIGRRLGILSYWFDSKHRRVAYRNLRIALADKFSVPQLKLILKKNYQNFGMNIVEALRLPKVNNDYLNRYISIKGKEYLDSALRNNTGAIILGAHFGSWEIFFAVAGILKYPFYIFAEEQTRNPLLYRYLDHLRQMHGVKVLKANYDSRRAIKALQEKKFLAMVVDHGVRRGALVNFFGRKTLAPSAALRISFKLNVPILISYLQRIKGPKHELVISPPLTIKRTTNLKEDVVTNLETINRITEDYIAKYPEQYLWFYKRFKFSNQRNILILHDGRVGHLRQIQAVLDVIKDEAGKRNLEIKTKQVEVKFRSKLSSILQALSIATACSSYCQGCLWCFKRFLNPQVSRELQSYFADIVISCGSQAAGVNFVIASENKAKSVVVMRPGSLSTKRFDLVIMPVHDNPPKRNNIIKTHGALNLIDEEYLISQASSISSQVRIEKDLVLGLFLGGDTKRFKLSPGLLKPLIPQLKLFLERYDGEILITTSRRTSSEAERMIKQEFSNYSRCKLLVIANEKNIPEAVGGILELSKIVIISPESISMISEAASSGRYVVVFNPQTNLGRRHTRFLERLVKDKYIYLTDGSRIIRALEEIIIRRPEIVKLQDRLLVREALGRLL